MVIQGFPPVECANKDGLVAVGGDLDIESLVLAYSNGIFPWPTCGNTPIPWFAPELRSVLFFKDLHFSHSFAKFYKKTRFKFTMDKDFQTVITCCARARNRKGQNSTWITNQIIHAYTNFHRAGYAHSMECWEPDGQLVGGIYGVSIGGMFAGESMFFLRPNASKCALVKLIEVLSERGATWMDCQVQNSFTESFGARCITRPEFQKLLGIGLKNKPLFP